MAFKTVLPAAVSLESPEALFRDLRGRSIPAPHAHQADVLREYQKTAMQYPDVALQLPTGSGKTLVGFLIGEWRRRKVRERVVYLCPTNQLVHQVVEQATTKYGIAARAFVGPKSEYDPEAKAEYQNGGCVAVTSYAALFNVNPFFRDPQLLVLDDAHAAENYIASYWSLRVERFREEHSALYAALAAALGHRLSPVDRARITREWSSRWDATWVDKLPSSTFAELADELVAIVDAHVEGLDLRYPWATLRGNLAGCHCYVGASEICIRPIIPPTMTHAPFAMATQRLYMSATLGAGGELERITGVKRIERLAAPPGWDNQGIGRRLFLFPGWSLRQPDQERLVNRLIQHAGRALVLVPDDRRAREVKSRIEASLAIPVFGAKELEASKAPFVSAPAAAAIVANRYDGIDFPQDECRMLVVDGLPTATTLQERFLVQRFGAIALLNDRILTRIIQACGRCTRDATDYSAVVILGEELQRYLLTAERRGFLHPELQAELEFGMQQSKGTTADEFCENVAAFLGRTQAWRDADGGIVALRQSLSQTGIPGAEELRKAVAHEVSYQYALWDGNALGALEAARKVLAELISAPLKGYRALWLYLAGVAAERASAHSQPLAEVAREYYRLANDASPGVRWLNALAQAVPLAQSVSNHAQLLAVIERLEGRLSALGTVQDRDFTAEEKVIQEGLAQSDHRLFEDAHLRLGRMLGFDAGNVESPAAPDPWWVADETLCFVFEDHSEAKPTSRLDVKKARQVASHPNWVRAKLEVEASAVIVPVLLTPVEKADPEALLHLQGVACWPLSEFRAWAKEALATVRDLRRSFPGVGDLAWRAEAMARYRSKQLDPEGLKAFFASRPAAEALAGDGKK